MIKLRLGEGNGSSKVMAQGSSMTNQQNTLNETRNNYRNASGNRGRPNKLWPVLECHCNKSVVTHELSRVHVGLLDRSRVEAGIEREKQAGNGSEIRNPGLTVMVLIIQVSRVLWQISP